MKNFHICQISLLTIAYCYDSEIPEYFSMLMGIIGEAGALRIKKNDTYPD